MEVNYIDVMNKFWLLRRSRRITSLQADLYYFLLNESNNRGDGRDWENPLECANGLVCSSIGCSENSLADARNVLQQIGLITFTKGITKTKSPTYYLNICGIDRGKHRGNERGNGRGNEPNTIIGKTKPKQNETSKSHCDAEAPPSEKKESTEHWDVLVKVWFDFYGEKFVSDDKVPKKPIFNAAQGKKFKHIIGHLKKSAKDANHEWVEDRAVRYLKYFLNKAWGHDDWIRQNFELGNLLAKFNSITNTKIEHGTGVQNSWGNSTKKPHDTSKTAPGTRAPL
jgi:hypothetical protein